MSMIPVPTPKPARLQLNLSGGSLCWRIPFCRQELETLLAIMLGSVDCDAAELDLLLVRDGDMAASNSRHMGRPGPTNILSFPLDESLMPSSSYDDSKLSSELQGERLQLGSLILSVDTLHRESLLYGQDLREHCLRLLSHGLGHLAGYDHGPEMDALCATMLEAALAWLNNQ